MDIDTFNINPNLLWQNHLFKQLPIRLDKDLGEKHVYVQ